MGFGLVGADGDGVGRGTLRALRIKDGLAISTSKSDGNKPFYRRDLKKKKKSEKKETPISGNWKNPFVYFSIFVSLPVSWDAQYRYPCTSYCLGQSS
jgi:hypothetical protein